MINGVRVRDSGVELFPHRNGPSGRPENGIQPHGSSFFGIRGRIDVMAHAADQTATFGQSGGMAWPTGHQATGPTHGHPFYSQVAHCYALVKKPPRGDRPRPASGLPWPFKPDLNSLKPAVHIGAPHTRP